MRVLDNDQSPARYRCAVNTRAFDSRTRDSNPSIVNPPVINLSTVSVRPTTS
jgi:hypothetical protein